MAKINWNRPVNNQLTFNDIETGDTFKIATSRSQGAVYMKVVKENTYSGTEHFMMEIATGKLFPATSSAIVQVPVEINIGSSKPNL